MALFPFRYHGGRKALFLPPSLSVVLPHETESERFTSNWQTDMQGVFFLSVRVGWSLIPGECWCSLLVDMVEWNSLGFSSLPIVPTSFVDTSDWATDPAQYKLPLTRLYLTILRITLTNRWNWVCEQKKTNKILPKNALGQSTKYHLDLS